jgi:hypothetical protein
MSLLLRAAIVGGLAYWITRSLSSASRSPEPADAARPSAPVDELHPGNNVWPSSDQQPAAASTGPTS